MRYCRVAYSIATSHLQVTVCAEFHMFSFIWFPTVQKHSLNLSRLVNSPRCGRVCVHMVPCYWCSIQGVFPHKSSWKTQLLKMNKVRLGNKRDYQKKVLPLNIFFIHHVVKPTQKTRTRKQSIQAHQQHNSTASAQYCDTEK